MVMAKVFEGRSAKDIHLRDFSLATSFILLYLCTHSRNPFGLRELKL